MEYFYFFTILVAVLAIFNRRLASILAILGGVFFLFYIPSTGFFSPDYFSYKDAYDTGYFIDKHPWVASASRIDAEVFYLRYTALIKVLSGQPFPFFLVFNFLLCVCISYFILKGFLPDTKQFFWLMFLPVLFPILFYFLIRSSISLFLVLLGFMSLLNPNKYKAVLFAVFFTYLGFNFHSQYILISLLFMFSYFVLRFNHINDYYFNLKFIVFFSAALVLILILLKSFVEDLSVLVSVVSESDLAQSKLGYLSAQDNRGFRITSLLSLVVYPFMMYNVLKTVYWQPQCYILKNKLKERKFLFLLTAVVAYTLAINIAYFDSAHLASRLGRFSDYVCMAVLVPLYFRICIGHKSEYFALIFIAIIAPFVYGSIYQDYYQTFKWNIF